MSKFVKKDILFLNDCGKWPEHREVCHCFGFLGEVRIAHSPERMGTMRSACEAAAGSPPEGVLRALQVGERISAESVHQVVRRATEGVQRTHGPPLARRQKRRGHAPSAQCSVPPSKDGAIQRSRVRHRAGTTLEPTGAGLTVRFPFGCAGRGRGALSGTSSGSGAWPQGLPRQMEGNLGPPGDEF